MVPIPAKPTANTDSSLHAADGTGQTSISFPHDIDAENEAFVINVGPLAGGGLAVPAGEGTSQSIPIVIEDDETQGITITRPTAQARTAIHEKSKTVVFNATAVPRREDLPLQVRFDLTDVGETSVSSRLYTLDRSVGTIPAGLLPPADVYPVTVNIPGNDLNREDDELEIHAEVVSFSLASGAFTEVQSDSAAFTVLDVHRLPLLSVAPATGTVMEDGEIELTVTIDRNPSDTTSSLTGEQRLYSDEAVNIMLSPGATSTADTDDYTITPNPISFAARGRTGAMQTSMKVKIVAAGAATGDDDIGDEMLVLDAAVAPTAATNAPLTDTDPYPAASTLTITDGTDALVSVKDGAYGAIQAALGTPPMLTKGMSGEFMATDLFMYDATAVDVLFSASVEGGAVTTSVSGDTVTVTAAAFGKAEVTMTADATMKASSLIEHPQERANKAQLTFPVDVVLSVLSVTVAANPMEIMEGGMSAITATANRPVEASDGTVKVDLSVVGDATLSAESITIAAGSTTTGSPAMVTAAEDDDTDDETVTVVASGSGITGTTQLTIAVTDNDAPPAATVTAKSQELVDAVFATAIATARTGSEWTEGDNAAMVDMSMLFDAGEDATMAYSGVSSDEMTVSASGSGMMLTLTPMAAGMATIMVTASDSASSDVASVSSMVTVAELPLSVTVSASVAMVAEGGSITLTADGEQDGRRGHPSGGDA